MEHIELKENQIVKDIYGNEYRTTKGDIVPIREKSDDFYGTDDKGNKWVKAYIEGEAYWFYAYSDKIHLMRGYDHKDTTFDNYIKSGNPAILHKNQIKDSEVRDTIESWLYYGEDKFSIAGKELTTYNINESVDTMTIVEFCNSVEQLYNKYFPKSLCNVWFDKQLGGSITIKCYLAKNEDEEDFHNFRNDMFNLGFIIYGFSHETTVDSIMPETFELEKIASIFLIKPEDTYHAFGSIKVPFKKITGDVNKVLFALNKHFDKFHDAVIQAYNSDLIHPNFVELVKEKL